MNTQTLLLSILSLILVGCGNKAGQCPKKHTEIEIARQNMPKIFPQTIKQPSWPSFCEKKESIQITIENNAIEKIKHLLKKHNINMQIKGDLISTEVYYTAHNKTILQILQEICSLHLWKLQINGNTVIIAKDEPYIHLHTIHTLNNQTRSTVQTSISADSKNNNFVGSNASLDNSTQNNIWTEIESYLNFLIQTYQQEKQDDHINQTSTVQRKQNQQEYDQQKAIDTQLKQANEISEKAIEALKTKGSQTRDIMDVGNDTSTSTPSPAYIEPADNEAKIPQKVSEVSYALNKQAGFIILRAPQKLQKELAKYIHKIETKMGLQIRLEARILEVDLNDEYKFGIDWKILDATGGLSSNFTFNNAGNNTMGLKMLFGDQEFNSFMDMLQKYGKTHTLSKPELTILHNETGMFKMVQNQVFFKMRTFETLHQNSGVQSNIIRSSDASSVPEGFSMTVQPAIDDETGEILMHIRPTITKVVGAAEDPAVALNNANLSNGQKVSSKYPVTSSREFDTKLRLKPGEWAVLGGHIVKETKDEGSGLPGVKAKGIGGLFGKQSGHEQTKEIVCILRAYPMKSNVKTLQSRLFGVYSG